MSSLTMGRWVMCVNKIRIVVAKKKKKSKEWENTTFVKFPNFLVLSVILKRKKKRVMCGNNEYLKFWLSLKTGFCLLYVHDAKVTKSILCIILLMAVTLTVTAMQSLN